MAKHDDDRPRGKEAPDPGGHPQENASDAVHSRLPWKSGSCLVRLAWYVLFSGLIIGSAIGLISELDLFDDESEAPSDSGTATTVADQGAASNEQSTEAAGPTSGSWDMYWTNSKGNESVGFTLRFMDDEYGTVEFPYDDRAYAGTWDINGDRISFGFARDFKYPSGSVTEWSSFEGTLVNPDLITGNWLRDDWSCPPDGGCSTKPVPMSFDSRLVRQP